jgi:hypothetical protein
MAIIKKGIIGGIKGSISNVTGYRRNNQDVIQFTDRLKRRPVNNSLQVVAQNMKYKRFILDNLPSQIYNDFIEPFYTRLSFNENYVKYFNAGIPSANTEFGGGNSFGGNVRPRVQGNQVRIDFELPVRLRWNTGLIINTFSQIIECRYVMLVWNNHSFIVVRNNIFLSNAARSGFIDYTPYVDHFGLNLMLCKSVDDQYLFTTSFNIVNPDQFPG